MKRKLQFLLPLMLLVGCSTNRNHETMETRPDPTTRTHSQAELQKTGRTNPGEALQQADPSVRLSHP